MVCKTKLLFIFEHILLPWGLKMISDSEPLLNYPFKGSFHFKKQNLSCMALHAISDFHKV